MIARFREALYAAVGRIVMTTIDVEQDEFWQIHAKPRREIAAVVNSD